MADTHQIHLKLLNGKTKALNFPTPTIQITTIKTLIHSLTSIPPHHQLLIFNNKLLQTPTQSITLTHNINPIHLLLRLRGGKGGFGSLLRGAATKAGQKKTHNFDACRDMSGRRLRHVNAEKKMEEWKAEAAERRLEKVAEDFIKKQVKEGKKRGKGGESAAAKYVEKYVNDSKKCMMDVDKAVRESVGDFFKKSGKKRKGSVGDGAHCSNKKMMIWKGKEKIDASDSDDTDEDDSDEEIGDQMEESVVINNEKPTEWNKETNGSSGSVTGGKIDGESSVGCSSDSTSSEQAKDSDEERHIQLSEKSHDGGSPTPEDELKKPLVEIHESMVQRTDEPCLDVAAATEVETAQKETEEFINASKSFDVEKAVVDQSPGVSTPRDCKVSDVEANDDPCLKPKIHDETLATDAGHLDLYSPSATGSDVPIVDKPIDFDEYGSAAEMEALGMERLKSELQKSGLKCGGTLQERAARLFLLKSTPVEKLPKKLLAKK